MNVLVAEMNRVHCCLFFDRIEFVEGNSPLESFFVVLKEQLKNGKVYLASRFRPRFITPLDEAKNVARIIPMTGLGATDVVEFFERRGISLAHQAAQQLDTEFEGMPLALELLIALVGENASELDLLAKLDTVREKVVDQLFEELYALLSSTERELLTTASLLRLPFTKARLLSAHRALFNSNGTEAFILLRQRCCVNRTGVNDLYQVHEIVAAMTLSDTDPSLKVLRQALAEHLLTHSPDDYTANLEALLLYKQTDDWDRAAEVAGELIYRRFIPYELESAEQVLSVFTQRSLSRERWMWLLGDKALVAHHKRRFAEAENLYSEMLNLARQLQNKEGEALALQRLGVLANDLGDDTRSEEYYRQCLTLRVELNDDEGQAQIYNNLGSIYSSRGDFANALRQLEKGVELRNRMGSPEWSYMALYSNLGILNATQEKWSEAFEYSTKALSIAEELRSPYDIAKCVFNIGKHEHERGNVTLAQEKFLAALEIADSYELDEIQELASIALGRLYGNIGDFDQAITFFGRAAGIYEEFNQKPELAAIYFDIGTFYQGKDDQQAALDWYLKGIELFEHFTNEKQPELFLANIRVMAHRVKDHVRVRELLRAIKKLKARLAERGVSFILARVYGTLGDIYREILSLERAAIACFHKEVRLLDELDRQRERVSAQIDLGGALEAYGRYSDALTVSREAVETAKDKNFSDLIGTILYNRGNYYAAVELYSLAEASYRDAEKYAPESNQVNILQMIQHNLSEVIRRQGRLDAAIELLKGVLSRERELNHAHGIVLALNNLGLAYEETEQQAEALSCWDEAVSISRLHSLKREEANSLISIGNFCLMRDQPEQAKRYYEEAWSAARTAGDAEIEEGCVLSLAESHRQLGTFESFQEEFEKAVEMADKLAHYENLVKFLTMAGQINLDEGESEPSAEMFEQAILLAYLRALQRAQRFDNSPDRPQLAGEITDVIGRIRTAIENCIDRDKPEVARNMIQLLIDRLKARNYFDDASFPLNYLTYVLEYIDLRPAEHIRRYIVKRLDAENSE